VSPPGITGEKKKKKKEKEMHMMPFRPSKKPTEGSFTEIHTPFNSHLRVPYFHKPLIPGAPGGPLPYTLGRV
jgi:hypothetical protein